MSDQLDGRLVGSYLSSLIEKNDGWKKYDTLNKRRIDPDDGNRYREWKAGKHNPTIWRVDRFLIKYGLYLDDFFLWCERQGVDPWLEGLPWFERDRMAA